MTILKPNAPGNQETAARPQSKAQKTGPFSRLLDEKRKELPAPTTPFTERDGQSAAPPLTSKTDATLSMPAVVNIDQLAAEIVDHIASEQATGASTIEIQFNSQTLSGLRVGVQSLQGVISVNFVTSAGAVAELLNNNLGNLRSTLESKGIRLAQLRVSRRTS